MSYKVLEMKFQDPNGKLVVLKGINTCPNQVVSSHTMISVMRQGDIEWDVECLITYQGTTIDIVHHHEDIKRLLHRHERVFEELPHRRTPDKGVVHRIELDLGTQPIKIHPYKHLNRFEYEIEKYIKDFLDLGHIRPSSIPFASSVVLV